MTMRDRAECRDGDRWGEPLVAYLYDDVDAAERARVESHLSECPACRGELEALGGVRRQLARWTPPEPGTGLVAARAAAPGRSGWRQAVADVPVWAQAAAALLCVGLSAGLANLTVRYGADGLSVRTGWLGETAAAPAAVASAGRVPSNEAAARPWQADLDALEALLRADLAAGRSGPGAVSAAGSGVDGGELARVQALIEASEQRQQRELALRLADLRRDVEYQRRDDLAKIDRSLGLIQANLGVMQNTGVEVMRQRQMINDLAVRVSQR